GDRRGLAGHEIPQQGRGIREVEYPGTARRDCNSQPDGVLERTQCNLARRPWPLVEADARVAISFNRAFDRKEEIDPHGLRTGVATPGAADRGREQEQAQARHHEQPRDEKELLRPDLDEEEVEASVGQIDQDSLVRGKGTPVPTYPGRQ